MRFLKSYVMVATFALLVGARFLGAASPALPGSGQQWLLRSPAERSAYVQGFIEGYWTGSEAACKNLDQIFEVGQPQRVGHTPRARCENRLDQYTKLKLEGSGVDFGAYTSVLTEFYSNHPEFQNIQNGYLMSLLTDNRYKTADQLYQMAVRREIDTHF